jgi:ACS family hexuronate transporter-like MFS transporter
MQKVSDSRPHIFTAVFGAAIFMLQFRAACNRKPAFPICPAGRTMAKLKNFRWYVAGLLALATALNYLDRLSFPTAIGEIKKTIPISDDQYGNLSSCFLIGYGIMYAGGGKLMDWLGTRIGYAVVIVWWSLANFMLGTVSSVMGLGVYRFMLGLGEGGGFPGSSKAAAEWFPARERSMAFGLFNTGSSLGAVVAAPLVAAIVHWQNWRWVFFVTGGIGFVWAVIWLKLYEVPARSKLVTAEEVTHISTQLALDNGGAVPVPPAKESWLGLFRIREVWGLLLVKFFSDSAGYFFMLWLPKYLNDTRNLDTAQIGGVAWISYAYAGGGSYLGGWLSSCLIRCNVSLDRSRKISLLLSAALMPLCLLIINAPLEWAIVLLGMALFGHQFFATIVQTLVADLFPARLVGSVAGLAGMAGAFGGALFAKVAGLLVGHYGYGIVFIVASILHPLSFVLVLLVIRRIRRVVP